MSEIPFGTDDPLARRLVQLAPSVDVPASRAVFERARARAGGGRPRWLLAAAVVALVVAGVAGVWAVSGGSDPVTPVDSPDPSAPTTGAAAFETLLVEETEAAFGQAWLMDNQDAYLEIVSTASRVPAIDFGRSIVLVMARPDNACPDVLTHFDIDPGAGGPPTWTPVFEPPPGGCDDPLQSWLYVVALDREALRPSVEIRIPADDTFGLPEIVLSYESGEPLGGPEPTLPPELSPTGVTLPLPDVGEPALHNTLAGLVWVVAHDDETVSVLPATIARPGDEDTGNIDGIERLVVVADDGAGFAAGSFAWDSHGRAVNGGRVNDLVGYAGAVDGREVDVLRSDATRIDGEIEPLDDLDPGYVNATSVAIAGAFGDPIDIPTFFTLSSSGPIWRHLDATLVVEDGVGRLCDVPAGVPVDQLAGCDDAEFTLDTAVRGDPGVTTWFHAPVLAFQDPIDGFTRVIPLGGSSSRAEDVTAACGVNALSAPPFLPSGAPSGDPTVGDVNGIETATWGPAGTPDAVMQVLGAPSEDFPIPDGSSQRVERNGYQIDVIPIGDTLESTIELEVLDPVGCSREYYVGPGVELGDAIDFARRWVDAWGSNELPTWELLGTASGVFDDAMPRWAVDEAAWDILVATLGIKPTAALDLDTHFAAVFNTFGDSCAPTIDLHDDGSISWSAEFTLDRSTACRTVRIVHSYAVAIPRPDEQNEVRLFNEDDPALGGAPQIDLATGELISGGLAVSEPPAVECDLADGVVVTLAIDSLVGRSIEVRPELEGAPIGSGMVLDIEPGRTWVSVPHPEVGGPGSEQSRFRIVADDPFAEMFVGLSDVASDVAGVDCR